MSCVLYGPDNRKRTASLLLDLEQIDRVIASLDTHDLTSIIIAGVTPDLPLRLTVAEVREAFVVRGTKIEHELALLGIKLSELPQPTTEKKTLPSIDKAKAALVEVTDSVTDEHPTHAEVDWENSP